MGRVLLLSFLCTIAAVSSAGAQEILAEPLCFTVRNTASHTINGSFITNYYMDPRGVQARHRSNFRLQKAGAVDEQTGYPADRAEFCSYGPFYEGRKLDLVLRTLVPVFSCRTNVEQGEILLHSEKRDDDTTKYWADCFE